MIPAPSLAAYHAEFQIERDGRKITLQVDCPDWASDEEILAELDRYDIEYFPGEVFNLSNGYLGRVA